MSIYERVFTLIKERGLSISKVEKDCGLSNATIRRWETQNPSLDSVRKVAHYLNVSIDYLAGEISEQSNSSLVCDGIPLSDEESDLIAMYRLLPEAHRRELFELTSFKYHREVEQGKDSIYSTYGRGSARQGSGPGEEDHTINETA